MIVSPAPSPVQPPAARYQDDCKVYFSRYFVDTD